MRVLIIEPHAVGHHANYLRWLLQAARERRWAVVVATTVDALSHPSLVTMSSDFGNLQIYALEDCSQLTRPIAGYWRMFRRELAYWKTFRRTASDVDRRHGIDLVVLPYIDYCFYALAILGSPFRGIPWCGISMRLAVSRHSAVGRRQIPFKWRMAKRVLMQSNLTTLFVINPSVREVPLGWYSATVRSKLRYLPDPAEYKGATSRASARASLGISDESIAILVFGSIDERKGLDVLASILWKGEGLVNYIAVVAGKRSASMRARMDTAPYDHLLSQKRLIIVDRILNEEEQGLMFAASDVVWLGYLNHSYMSGVLVLAGRAGLPVVGTVEGEIGRMIIENNLGIAVHTDVAAEVAAALRVMLDENARRKMGLSGQGAFENHTVEQFGDCVLGAFDSA